MSDSKPWQASAWTLLHAGRTINGSKKKNWLKQTSDCLQLSVSAKVPKCVPPFPAPEKEAKHDNGRPGSAVLRLTPCLPSGMTASDAQCHNCLTYQDFFNTSIRVRGYEFRGTRLVLRVIQPQYQGKRASWPSALCACLRLGSIGRACHVSDNTTQRCQLQNANSCYRISRIVS